MSKGAHWISNRLFLGRVQIGKIEVNARDDPKHVLAMSFLPGASYAVGFFLNEAEAKLMVEKSANARMHAMLEGSVEDVANAMATGRDLRKVCRAIYRAGVWTCDRPTYAHAMFTALGKVLSMAPGDAPQPLDGVAYDQDGQCSAFEAPDDGELVA